jgi:hypothetical protein
MPCHCHLQGILVRDTIGTLHRATAPFTHDTLVVRDRIIKDQVKVGVCVSAARGDMAIAAVTDATDAASEGFTGKDPSRTSRDHSTEGSKLRRPSSLSI